MRRGVYDGVIADMNERRLDGDVFVSAIEALELGCTDMNRVDEGAVIRLFIPVVMNNSMYNQSFSWYAQATCLAINAN